MPNRDLTSLETRLGAAEYRKLAALPDRRLHEFVADAVDLCDPASVFVCTDSAEEIRFIREQAVALGEETPLAIPGHTVHFDGYYDQGRDREATKYLVPAGESLSRALNQVGREAGLAEIRQLLRHSMRGRRMIIRFLALGPVDSVFTIPCVQCTDSFYVVHSEDLLYRPGYEQFKRLKPGDDFFRVLHSAGRLDARQTSAEPDKKLIYIDYACDTIYSVNTQYAGNTVGLKKLSLRLTIRKAGGEGWLAEHMFLMGVHGPGGRKTYFAGAFPSGCGKTSTAMLPGETIVGDDIAYLRHIDGEARAVNAECGIFGIIQNINPVDDPVTYRVLTTPGEIIFSNVLVNDRRPYWLGMGVEVPEEGTNYAGPWRRGLVGPDGETVPPAHKNARYTVSLACMPNLDPELENPAGVPLGAIIYGGRDVHCSVPVRQSFDWAHGIITCGAALETETTFAIIGQEGRRELNVMSIQDFLSISVGAYIGNNLDFGAALEKPPLIFGVNYFLVDEKGAFLTGMRDKAVWVKWMERRVHGELPAVATPTGWIPRCDDLQALFRDVLGQYYPQERYDRQFTVRVPENLTKLERVERFFHEEVADPPPVLFEVLAAQRERLVAARERFGDRISPLDLADDAGA